MMALIDNAVYVGGRRTEDPASLNETYEVMRARGGMAWIGLYRPNADECARSPRSSPCTPSPSKMHSHGHQRSKLELYGDTLFVVLRPARYLDDVEEGRVR